MPPPPPRLLRLSAILAAAFVAVPVAAQGVSDTAGAAPPVLAPADSATATMPPVIALPLPGAQARPNPQAAAPPPPGPDTSAAPSTTDLLLQELIALRRSVEENRARTDSLARGVAANRARADTLAARTDAARVAQQTVERVGQEATRAVQNFIPKLLLSALLVLAALYVLRGIIWLIEALAARSAERRLAYKRLIPIARLLVWSLAVYLIIGAVFQIDTTTLFAAAAAIGVAIGFAAQDVLKNIFGGIVIVFDRPFQVGDKVAVEGTYGEVVSIGLRSTRIVTPDDNLVTVPNSQVVDGQVSNANAGELNLQIVTDLYLPGWVDVALAKRIAYEAAANSKYVYLTKPIVVICKDEFKETFLLHLRVKAYVLDIRYENLLLSDITEAAKAEFLRHGLLPPMVPAPRHLDGVPGFDPDADGPGAASRIPDDA